MFIRRGQYLLSAYMLIMLILFRNFYIAEYIKKQKDRKLDVSTVKKEK